MYVTDFILIKKRGLAFATAVAVKKIVLKEVDKTFLLVVNEWSDFW